jgi:uncharacterized membrane protein
MTDRRLRILIAALATVGLGIASYLTYTRYADATIACSISQGCALVESSSYAVIAGVPVAVVGVVGYLAIALSVLGDGPQWRRATLLLVTGAAGFGVYLLLVQIVVLEAICQWCVASEAISFALLGPALVRARRSGGASLLGRA